MNQNVLRKQFFLCLFFLNIILSQRALSQSCDNALSLPSQGAKVTVGDVDVAGNQLTVEAMFNRTAALNNGLYYGHLVSKHTDQTNVNYALLPNGCEITTSTSGYKAIFQTCVPELNKTYHVAMVYDGTTLKFYRNGFLMSQVACTGNIVNNDLLTTIAQLAGNTDPANNQFLGYTNEVRIWKVARSQSQIQAYMDKALPNPTTQTGLVAYYSFNDLANKQGNVAFNGTIGGGAISGVSNPACSLTPSSCNTVTNVQAGFTMPDTVCVNTPVNISNISLNATSSYWNFCAADPNVIPSAVNLGNPGGSLSLPVFSDVVNDNGNYYVFVSNNWPGGLVRLDFGNSLLNNPTVVNLGNVGGVIPGTIEGIQVVRNEGRWYAIMVGGDANGGIPSRIIKIDFGPNITNINPVGTNWGNIGNLAYPVDLHIFQENGIWYGFTVNAQNNTITRFNFSNSFNNIPTGVNLGNLGGLNYPTGINAVKDNGNWYVFITNDVDNSFLVRLNFGNSLLNAPTAVNLGNPGNVLHKTRDIYILKACDEITALAVNGDGYSDLVKLDFNNNITSVPAGITLGNTGNMNFPHSISELFRVGNDLYSFITNVNNNTITRIRFQGCTNSSIPNSSLQNPPPVTYSTPGTYNINLTIDEGLPTQASLCKQVVVKDCEIVVGPLPTSGCGGFQFALGGNAYDRAYDVAATTNNEFFVAGVSKSFSTSDDILVSRLTAAGSVIWSKTFGNNNTELLRKITPTADGGLLIVGQTKSFSNSKGDILCMKINSTGTLVWSKILGVGSVNGDLGMDIIETSDGGYAVSGILNVEGTVADAVVIKLDNAANVIWSKRFDRGDGDNGVGLFQKGDTLIVSIDLQNTIYNYETLMMKLKLVDGTFIMAKKLTPATRGLYNPYIHKDPLQPGYIVSLHTIDNSSYTKMNHTILNLDEDFNIRKSRLISIDPPTNDFYTGMAVLPDGSFIGTSTNQTNGDGCIYRINDDNSGVFVKKFNAAAARRLYRVAVSGQQLMAVGGAIDNGQEDFFITSFDITGALGAVCDVEDIALKIQQPVFTVSPFTWPTISDVSFPASSAVLNAVNAPLQNKDLCPVSRPDFSIKRDPCNPKTIQIETNLTNIQNYEWDFGDGQTNVGNPNPVVTYTDFDTYIIKLKTQNIAGCADSTEKQISVNVINDSLIITNDTTICYGTTKQLVTASALSFCWSPITYLDNPNSPNPVTSATQDITYFFTAEVTGANLITNGNFSQGNTGFTSGYNFASSNTTEGQYFVGSNPQSWNSSLSACKDHTAGNGNMMLVNGSPTVDVNVWKQTVNVTPNTNYAFSTWIQALWPPNPAQLQFSINGKDAGSLITASLPTCTWTQFHTTWNSGNNTTAVISIVNKNTQVQGNDFALDDISFAPVFIKRDSVKIKVEKPFVQANVDTSICTGKSAQLNATGAENYVWSPATGLSAPAIANPVASPAVSTAYIVTGTTVNGCSAKDTVHVNIYAKPAIAVSDDTLICKNALAQLSVTGGASYSWSPAATLNDPLVASPVASPLVNTKYYVTITDANTCEHLDSVQVSLRPDAVFTINSPQPVCRFDSAQLIASGGDIYSWQPANGLSNTSISNPTASPAVTTDYTVTITENTCHQSEALSARITVKPLPIVNAAKANDIDCRNDRSQLNATGADQYVWAPAATLNNPGVANPVAKPAVSTEYIVTGTEDGCSANDTVVVQVYTKPAIIISSDTMICKNARAQLFVTGGNSYSWSPAATLSDQFIANPVASPLVNTKYYVTIKDANSCEYLDSVSVSVRPDPAFSINAPGKVCLFDSVQLNAAGGDIYAWQPAEGLDNIASNPWVSPAVTADYKVTITETTCNQSATLSTRLTVMPLPTVNAVKSNDIDCSNDRSQLNVTGAAQYEWTPAPTLNNPGIANPVATPATTTAYVVKGTDTEGCTGYDTITVKVDNVNKGGYLMPNAFTPNNDGLNDCYGVKYWGVIEKFEFSIYNRWGERIFTTKNPGQCWDGTYKGVEQDGGVYVYMIKAKTICEAEVFRKGTFTLIR
ncbi:gliding motility-associated C-terminal domain-containing protein [Terrimonas pollutisoli]|uniref:T9SS type B sorting domain-containing protein n=1 Tax=Terrimonas pollutisoli TaxID=3034147 RepID=UPI0023EB1AC9|nr:gliding motility-associated C-terminal domain-containing protein [Terrimonas sp. H1YJ31]